MFSRAFIETFDHFSQRRNCEVRHVGQEGLVLAISPSIGLRSGLCASQSSSTSNLLHAQVRSAIILTASKPRFIHRQTEKHDLTLQRARLQSPAPVCFTQLHQMVYVVFGDVKPQSCLAMETRSIKLSANCSRTNLKCRMEFGGH